MIGGSDRTVFTHLLALSDDRGVFEHARLDEPRREGGYCVDDVARALIVLVREPRLEPAEARLAWTCLAFVDDAVAPDGRVRNRMSADGEFTDAPSLGDWWGRAVWALGTAAARGTDAVAARALEGFRRVASARSPYRRAMAFAALGAREVLGVRPGEQSAQALLRDAAGAVGAPGAPPWPWPEERLRYANAAVPEALLACGDGLGDAGLVADGIELLRFLLATETADGHLSVTGTRGRGPSERGPLFDQQSIEVAAIADACARAFVVTGDEEWRSAVAMAWSWFLGDNDTGVRMFDHESGAGYDGLTPTGRNENRGAESTLAALSTFQQARRLGVLSTVAG